MKSGRMFSIVVGAMLVGGLAQANTQSDVDSAATLQSPSTRGFVTHADRTLARLDTVSGELGLKFVGPDYFLPDSAVMRDNDTYDVTIRGKTVEYRSAAYWITFRVEDHLLVGFYNPQVTTFESGPNSPSYYPPDSPTWTPEKAIAIATAFRDVFIDPFHVKLGHVRAKYDHTMYRPIKVSGKDASAAYLGSWYVDWPRVDRFGHPFYGDGVRVVLSEKYGLSGVNLAVFTPFRERVGKIITMSDALNRAQSYILQNFSWERWWAGRASSNPYDTILGDKLKSAALMIAVPTFDWKKGEGLLVWEFWFEPIHKAPPSGPTYDDRFSVWIDAYTGKVVGGDAVL